ncbi:MAG: twin transmembrane helix small protein [Ferrovibrio sp.]
MQGFINALIPVFAVAAFLVLCVGIYALFRGGQFNRSYSNLLMRWRILLQFIAIILIAVASFAFRN